LNSRTIVDLLASQIGIVLAVTIQKKFFKNDEKFSFFPGNLSFIPKIKFNVLGYLHDGINRFLDATSSTDESTKERLLDDSMEHLGKAICRMNFCAGANFVFSSIALHETLFKSPTMKLSKKADAMKNILTYFEDIIYLDADFPANYINYSISLLEYAKLEEKQGNSSKAKKLTEKAIENYQISKNAEERFPIYGLFAKLCLVDVKPYLSILDPPKTLDSKKSKRSSMKLESSKKSSEK